MHSTDDQEHQWLQKTSHGDRVAFERLYRAYQGRVFGYIFRMVRRADVAEELVTDVMVEVWKQARSFRGDSQVSTWIFGIARFKALSALRRPKVEAAEEEAALAVPDSDDRPDERLDKLELSNRIKSALARLSDDHREVMELTFYEGFSYPEIARIVECPVNTVKTRMFHARRQLRMLLAHEVPHE